MGSSRRRRNTRRPAPSTGGEQHENHPLAGEAGEFVEKIEAPGYVVEPTDLELVEQEVEKLLPPTVPDEALETTIIEFRKDGNNKTYPSLKSFLRRAKKSALDQEGYGFGFRRGGGRVIVSFQSTGRIILKVSGLSGEASNSVAGLVEVLENLDNELGPYSEWLVREDTPRKVLLPVLFFTSLFLLYQVGSYIYVSRSAVDVAPELANMGNEYYQDVEAVLADADLEAKLNVLLRGQFRYFSNKSDLLDKAYRRIAGSAFVLCASLATYGFLKALRRVHPAAYFAIGRSHRLLQKMQARRDILKVVIGIGFAVNLLAGLTILILS